MISDNPNATVAAVAGAITAIIVWVLGSDGGAGVVDIPDGISAAITTVVIAAILYVGRRGGSSAPAGGVGGPQ